MAVVTVSNTALLFRHSIRSNWLLLLLFFLRSFAGNIWFTERVGSHARAHVYASVCHILNMLLCNKIRMLVVMNVWTWKIVFIRAHDNFSSDGNRQIISTIKTHLKQTFENSWGEFTDVKKEKKRHRGRKTGK